MATKDEKKGEENKKQNGPQSTVKKPATKKSGSDSKTDKSRSK